MSRLSSFVPGNSSLPHKLPKAYKVTECAAFSDAYDHVSECFAGVKRCVLSVRGFISDRLDGGDVVM
jgi:hypothetical protein